MVGSVLSEGSLTMLGGLLGTRPVWRRSPVVLTVRAALEELAVTLEEVGEGRGAPRTADRGSLVCDLDLALTRVGPHLRDLTSPDLKNLRTGEVSNLAATLDDPVECRRVAALARQVLNQLRSDDAVKAAWDDVVEALTDGASAADDCALRVDQLNELLLDRGHELWIAHSGLHELVGAGDLDQAREVVAQPPPEDATVAWVAFGNADLGRAVLRVGQVRFFNGRYGLKALRDQCNKPGHSEFSPIDELTDHRVDFYLSDVEAEHVVYARVELAGELAKQPPGGRRVPPVTWARQLASDLVEAAGFRYGGTEWIALNGGFYVTGRDTDGGSAGFDDPRRQAEQERALDPRFEPTAGLLSNLPPAFADALAEGQEPAEDAAEAVRWHREVSKLADPRMRVALHVRRFEVQWSTGDEGGWGTWEEPLRHYLKDSWCRHAQDNFLFRVGYRLHGDSRLAHPKSGAVEAGSKVYAGAGNNGFRINLRETLLLAPQVASGFPGGTLQRRLFKEAARRTASGGATQEWWRELRRDFDVLLNRAVRQRNRVIHGRQPVAPVIESVDEFISGRSATLAAQAVVSAASDKPVDQVLEDEREDLAQLFDAMAGEGSALALFGKKRNE
jgi:hypothetical protein